MKHSILYYPKFEPGQKWLRSVLLFADEIQRVVPTEAEHVDASPIQSLLEVMPDALTTISPLPEDKYFSDGNFARLKKALKLIRDETGGISEKPLVFSFDMQGRVSMKGNVLLSGAKLEPKVRELLLEYDLANNQAKHLLGLDPSGDTLPTNEEASNLIVSYVADQMAKRIGIGTITDVAIPHTVQSLDALGASATSFHREGDGLIGAAVANLAVPRGVEHLAVHEFQELRHSFQEIRAPFHELIRSLSAWASVNQQQSATALESRVERAIEDFQRQMATYKKSVTAKQIDSWAPVCLQWLIGIAGAFSPAEIKAVAATGLIGIEVMKRVIATNTKSVENEKTYRLLCRLGKKIDQKALGVELT